MSTPRPPAVDRRVTEETYFTPGPWSYYLDDEGYFAITHSSEEHDPGDVAHVYVPGSIDPEYDDHGEGKANARLIAAAPLLFEALRQFVGRTGHTAGCTRARTSGWRKSYPCSTRCQQARAALAAVTIPAEEETP